MNQKEKLNEKRNPENDEANKIIRNALNNPEYAKTHATELRRNGIKYIPPQQNYGDGGALEGKNGRRLSINYEPDYKTDTVDRATGTYPDGSAYSKGYDYYTDTQADRKDLRQKTYKDSKENYEKAKRNFKKQETRVKNLEKKDKEAGLGYYSDTTSAARRTLSNYKDALAKGVYATSKDTNKIHPDVDLKGFLNAKKHTDRELPLEKTPGYNNGENKAVAEYRDLKYTKNFIDKEKERNKEEDKNDQERIEYYKQKAAEDKARRDTQMSNREAEYQARKDIQDKKLADFRKRLDKRNPENSSTFDFVNSLNEKINKDNVEINRAIANIKRGHNIDKVKQAGYSVDWDGERVLNKETGKSVWPSEISKDKRDKIDLKGMLDNPRPKMDHTRRFGSDVKDNRIPKSAKVNNMEYNNDEVESYSPRYNDEFKKSISKNVNYYKKAVQDRDDNLEKVDNANGGIKYYQKQLKDVEKHIEREKEWRDMHQQEANDAEERRKKLMTSMRARKEELKKNKVNNESVVIKAKKKLNEKQELKEHTAMSLTNTDPNNHRVKPFVDLFKQEYPDYTIDKLYLETVEGGWEPCVAYIESDGTTYRVFVGKLNNGIYMSNNDSVKIANGDYQSEYDYINEQAKLSEYEEGTDYEKYTKLIVEIKNLAEENGYNLPEDEAEKIADKMVDDGFFYDYDLPEDADYDSEEWQEIHNVITGYLENLNESEKLILNEEQVGALITAPSDKFWVGDPCYVLSDEVYYGIWEDKYNFKDGKIDVDDDLSFIVHGTAWGDGSYDGNNGNVYGVDSGTLAVIPMDLVAKSEGVKYGSVETSDTAVLNYDDGEFRFEFSDHTLVIDTDPSENYDDYDDYEDEELEESAKLNEEVDEEAYMIAREIAKEIRYIGCLSFTTVNERIYDLSDKSQEEIDNSDFINDVYGCLNYEGINQNQSTGDFYTDEYAKEDPSVLEESEKLNEEWLEPEYDSAVSFYKKARTEGDKLYSYDTLVAEIKDGKPVVYGTYSQTTLRHIKEWLKQNGFKAENSKQIMNDYGIKEESEKLNEKLDFEVNNKWVPYDKDDRDKIDSYVKLIADTKKPIKYSYISGYDNWSAITETKDLSLLDVRDMFLHSSDEYFVVEKDDCVLIQRIENRD